MRVSAKQRSSICFSVSIRIAEAIRARARALYPNDGSYLRRESFRIATQIEGGVL
jgi:hypothetical protein